MPSDAVVLDPPSDRSRLGVLTSVRAHLTLILSGLLVGAALGWFGSALLPTSYTAEASFYLGVEAPFTPAESDGGGDATRFAADQAELALTTDVLGAAGAAVVPPVPVEEARKSVTGQAAADTSRVTVTVVRPDPEQARALADAVVAAYRETSNQRVDDLVAAATEGETDVVFRREIQLRAAAYGDGVVAVEPASLPTTASAPQPAQNALLGGLLGLALATGAAIVRDQRRARRASVADLDLLLGAPLITRFAAPDSAALEDMIVWDASSDAQPPVNDVLTAIDVALEGDPNPSVLFLSWQRALTTTSLVASVALSATRAGRSVVVIDGGLKDRGISALTDIDPGAGLEALADPAVPLHSSLRTWRMGKAEVGVVPITGWTATSTGAAARPQVLRSAIARLHDVASLTLVDGPPLTERSLGLALGRGVGGVVLVVDEETSVDDAHEMGRRIALAGVGVLGYVLAGPAGRAAIKRSWTPQRRGEGPLALSATVSSHRR